MTGNDSPDLSHQSKPKGELGMKSELMSRLSSRCESLNFLMIGKIIGSILLLGMIFIWTLFLIVIVPMIFLIVNHGKTQKQNPLNLSLMMIPAAICGLLLWRIWYPKWNPNFVDSKRFESIRRYLPAPQMKRPVR